MADMVIELSDGSEVRLHEVWNCCDGIHDSGSMIEVYNNEDDSFVGSFLGIKIHVLYLQMVIGRHFLHLRIPVCRYCCDEVFLGTLHMKKIVKLIRREDE